MTAPTWGARPPGATAPLVLAHPGRVALLGGELVANRLRARPDLRLILPTGHTPLGTYAELRAHLADGSLPTGSATLFQLDEYIGLGPDDSRSYQAYLRRELHGFGFAATHLLDGTADPEREAARHQRLLDEGPVDLVVLGLGRDGHVAFDEPGSTADQGVRRVTLAPETRQDAAGDFGGDLEAVPREALTVGLRTLVGARELVMLVSGDAKAPALRDMLQGPKSPACPASLLRDHPRLTIISDREAAALLEPAPGWSSDHAIIVLGHREPGVSNEHRISAESHARLRRAERLARDRPTRVVILTGYTRLPVGFSEAEQMKADWRVPGVPTLLEDAGRNTAENASRSLPLVRAIGDIRRVTVVTSTWHVRAPYFFAPYRLFGLRLSFATTPHGRWGRMLWHELREAPRMRRERRAAMAAMRLPAELVLPGAEHVRDPPAPPG